MTVVVDGTNGVTSPRFLITNGTSSVELLPPTTGTLSGVPLFQSTTGAITLTNATGGSLVLQPAAGSTTATTLAFPNGVGTNGQVLTSNGSGGMTWGAGGGGGLTIGTSTITGGTTGTILINTSGVLQQLLMGTGVSALLAAAANGPNGLVSLNGSGALPASSSGTFGSASSTTGTLSLFNASSAFPLNIQSGNNTSAWTLTLPIGPGTNGQVLTTNGSGTTSWTTPASGLTVGTTAIAGGTTGSILIDTSGVLQQIVMGTGVSALLAAAANGPNGLVSLNGSGNLPTASSGTFGTAGTTTGTLSLFNSGSAFPLNLQSGANSAAWTLTLPTGPGTSGQVLTTNGSGVTTWTNVATVGGTNTQVQYNNSGVLAGASGFTFNGTSTLGLGVAGASTGIINLGGSTSGTVTVQPANSAGTWTLTLPVDAGTNKYALTTNGSGVTSWSQIDAAAALTGVVSVANGGTGLSAAGTMGTTLVSNGSAYAAGYPDRATNIEGGAAWEIPYQSAANTTDFVIAGVTDQLLSGNTGAAPSWLANTVKLGTTTIKVGAAAATTVINDIVTLKLTQDPTSGLEAATKQYVDAKTAGLQDIGVAKAATTGNITRSGPQTIDTISVVAGDIVLVKNQTLPQENGLYEVQAAAWTYAASANTWAEYPSAVVFVQQGATNANTSWIQTDLTPAGTLGTTPQSWVIQSSPVTSYSAGTGINIVTNQITNSGVLSVSGGSTGLTFNNATGATQLQGTLAPANGGTGVTSLGTGVAALLQANANGPNGIVSLDASGDLPAATSGTFGTASTTTGDLILYNSGAANPVTINSGANTAAWTLTLPVDGGTNGYVLKTNGSGVTSWAADTTTPGGATTQVQYNNAGAMAGSAGFTFDGTNTVGIGVAGTSTGTLNLNGSTSGTVTIKPQNAAGTWTLTLPADDGTAGQALVTDGSGVATWATVGSGTVNSGTANQMAFYSATGTAVSGNANVTVSTGALTLGVAGTAEGSLVLSGSTAGTVTVKTAATAGGWTLTLPANDGNANQVLTTNGSGVTSWSTPTGYSRTDTTATAGQTTFSATYTPTFEQVYLNGVLLALADYTATSGTDIVLSVGASAGDIVTIVVFK